MTTMSGLRVRGGPALRALVGLVGLFLVASVVLLILDASPDLLRRTCGLSMVLAGAFAALAFIDRSARAERPASAAYLLMLGVVLVLPISFGMTLLIGSAPLGGTPWVGLQLMVGVVLFAIAWSRLGTPASDAFGVRVVILDAVVAFFASLALLVLRAAQTGEITTMPDGARTTVLAQSLGFAILVWVLGRSRERGPVPWKQLMLWTSAAGLFLVAGVEPLADPASTTQQGAVAAVGMCVALVLAGVAALRPEGEPETPRDVRLRVHAARLSSTVAPAILFLVLLVQIWRGIDVPRQVALLSMCALAGVLLALAVIRRTTVDHVAQSIAEMGRAAMTQGETHPWLETVVGQGDDVISVVDQYGHVMYQTPSAARVLGYAPGTWIGRDFRELVDPAEAPVLDAALDRASRAAGARTSITVHVVQSDGAPVLSDLTVTAISSMGRPYGGFVLALRLIPDSMVPRAELERASATDALTGRPNLVGFRRTVEQAARVHGQGRAGILILDLDGFTALNDRIGHEQGDELLIKVGDAIDRSVRPWDVVARLGADEFAVLVVGPNVERAIVRIHERVRRMLAGTVLASGAEVLITARAGYAVQDASTLNAAELLRNADLALSRARTSRNVALQPYHASMHSELLARAAGEAAIRAAFDRSEFELHYQPVVALPSRVVIGVEALIRWNHPTRGLLAPGEFLRLVEDLGLGRQLCTWVVQESARVASILVAIDPGNARMAVGLNVAAEDLSERLVRDLESAARVADIDSSRLVIEVTEESLVAAGSARDTIADLRTRGFKVAIDDFGVGYSSLSYLESIPVDFIKVDRSFINDVTHGSTKAALVGAVISLGEALSLDAVVEGVETQEELEVVYELGARFAQGWHFAPALPLGQIIEMLQAQAPTTPSAQVGVEPTLSPTRLHDELSWGSDLSGPPDVSAAG